ncbi:O-antigen ligase family protein, partial [Patescibacteria group bacterium]
MRIFKGLARFFFILFLIVLPFGQLLKLPFQIISVEVNGYLTDVFLGLAVGFWFLKGWEGKKELLADHLFRPIVFFALVCLGSLLRFLPFSPRQELLVAFMYLIRWVLYVGIYFLVVDFRREALFKKRDFFKARSLLGALAGIGVMVAILGLAQYLLWPDLREFTLMQWDPHYYRVVSTFLDPGFTGMFLVLTLVLVTGLFLHISEKRRKERKALIGAGVIAYLALALTYSRSSFLAFLVGALSLGRLFKKKEILLGAILVMTLTIIVLPRRPGGEGVKLSRWASIQARIENWQETWSIFQGAPLLGVGFGRIRYVKDKAKLGEDWQLNHAGAGSDSSLLLVLATTGVIGFFAYLWLVGHIFWVIWFKGSFSDLSKVGVSSLVALGG